MQPRLPQQDSVLFCFVLLLILYNFYKTYVLVFLFSFGGRGCKGREQI